MIECVIVVKAFDRAKSRLSSVLDAPARAGFARQMFEHVLRTCAQELDIDRVWVATDDDAVARLATGHGARVFRDDGATPLGCVIDRAMNHLADNGATHAIAIMSDLPELEADELRKVIDALRDHDVVIAADRARRGTNLLALRLPAAMRSCFGQHDSFEAHVKRADEAQLRLVVVEAAGIAFDVDTPEDYGRLSRP